MSEPLKPGDRVYWVNVDGRELWELYEDCGDGPFKVYKVRNEGSNHFVSLVAEDRGQDWAIDPRLGLRWPISDIDKYGEPPIIFSAKILKKI